MERIIDELVYRGDEVIRLIESDINDFEKKYEKENKDFRNRYFAYRLAQPISYNNAQDCSLGFIELDEENSTLFINDYKLQLKAEEIFKKRIETLRRTLLNKEINFITLRSILELNGYYALFDDKVKKDIEDYYEVFYTAENGSGEKIEISFFIIDNVEVDEIEENFWVRVTGIKRI